MNIEVKPSPKMNPETEKKLQEHLREMLSRTTASNSTKNW